MYNPSNHIPLSKAMGPNDFPLDGKYMFFTNGASGVYKYRPFQSTAEVLTYFPLGSDFRGSQDGQSWSFEILINEGGTLSGDGGSITGGINSVWWFRNGVSDADLVKKVSDSIFFDKLVTKDGSDVIDYELDLSGESGIPYPASATLYVNKKAISASTWDFDAKLWTGLPDTISGDIIEAYYIGREYVAPPFVATILIKNNSSADLDFQSSIGSPLTLMPGQSFSGPTAGVLPPGAYISVSPVSGQTSVYTIKNPDNSTYFTHTLIGPGTENGIANIYDKSQEFIISNT